MKKTLFLNLLVVITLFSCDFKEILLINDVEDLVAIQKIIDENYDSDSEVYKFSLNASALKSTLQNINRTYTEKDIYFHDSYDVMDKKFSDPKKAADEIFLKTRKPFKIGAIDLSIIPEKYNEAQDLLTEKGLLAADKGLPMSSWTFRTDSKGAIYSEFVLDFKISSSTHGRVQTTNYNSYKFEVDSNNTLKLVE